MASRRKKKEERKLTEKDISGLKYFHKLDGLLSQLHDVGCDRDTAGNRTLHMDQYCMLVLLYLFNPIVSSLRAVQQASELKNVQKKLGCSRVSLGSLSESVTVFDADRLKAERYWDAAHFQIGQRTAPNLCAKHESPFWS